MNAQTAVWDAKAAEAGLDRCNWGLEETNMLLMGCDVPHCWGMRRPRLVHRSLGSASPPHVALAPTAPLYRRLLGPRPAVPAPAPFSRSGMNKKTEWYKGYEISQLPRKGTPLRCAPSIFGTDVQTDCVGAAFIVYTASELWSSVIISGRKLIFIYSN